MTRSEKILAIIVAILVGFLFWLAAYMGDHETVIKVDMRALRATAKSVAVTSLNAEPL